MKKFFLLVSSFFLGQWQIHPTEQTPASAVEFFLDDEMPMPEPTFSEPSRVTIYAQRIGVKLLLTAYACKNYCIQQGYKACHHLKKYYQQLFLHKKTTATSTGVPHHVG